MNTTTAIKRNELETKFLGQFKQNIRLVDSGIIRIANTRREVVNDREVLIVRLEAVGQNGANALKSPAAASIASRVAEMEGCSSALDLKHYAPRPVAMEKQIRKLPIEPGDYTRFYIDYRAAAQLR